MNNKGDFNLSWKTCAKVIICVLIVFLCVHYWGSIEGFFGLLLGGMVAIFSGLAIAYILNIPMRFPPATARVTARFPWPCPSYALSPSC